MPRTRNDLLVDFDGDAAERKLECLQEIGYGGRCGDLAPLTVNKNANALNHAQILLTQVAVPRLPWTERPHGSRLDRANGRGRFDPRERKGNRIAAICIDDVAQRRGGALAARGAGDLN